MALKDRIYKDNRRLYMNMNHFAETHTWNGKPFNCVLEGEEALKRKNNNVADISWDNNTSSWLVYVPVEDFPGRALPNEHGLFDKIPARILSVARDMGMYTLTLVTQDPKAVAQ